MKGRKVFSAILSSLLIVSAAPLASANTSVASGKAVTTTNVKKGSNKVSDVIQVHKNAAKSKVQSVVKTSKKQEFSKDEVLVKYKTTVNAQAVGTVEKGASIKKSKDLGSTGFKLYKITDGSSVDQTIAKLRKSTNVAYVQPNYKVTKYAVTDPFYSQLWGLKNTGQNVNGYNGTAGMDINAEAAWAKTTGANVVVGVVDEGIDFNHPDLKNNAWVNPGEIAGDGIDNDHNGYVDDINGWDFYNHDNSVYDSNNGDEHGTHVAGTIGASANNVGVIGVAPNVKLVSLKFMGPDGGYDTDAIEAIQYADKMGIKILNNSWGSNTYDQALYDAIKNYHGLFVAAAGNDGVNTDSTPSYPAAFDLPNIISVASIDNTGNLSWFSNYGANSVDVAAPGEDIYSTAPYAFANDYNNDYQYMSGTSMATPHVTGSAALVLATHPSYTAANIKQALMDTSKKLSTLTGKVVSGGLINVGSAVSYTADNDNDIPGTTWTGSKVSNSLDAATDTDDVYAVTLSKGEKITASLSGAAGTDFDLYLYDSKATTVKSSDGILKSSEKGGTSSESVTFVAPAAGTYYLDTYAYSGKGTYTLSVTLGGTAGIYDNKSDQLNYVSTKPWSVVANAYASSGSYSTINASNSSVQLVFNGTGIQYNALKNKLQGMAKVTLDGAAQTVDLYSTVNQYNTSVYEKTGLAAGTHTLKIEWTGQKNTSASSTAINIDSIVVTHNQSAKVEENNANITYSGTWTSQSSTSFSGGAAKYNSVKGNAAEYKFTGEGLTVLGKTASNQGKADIYVDGVLVKTADLYSSTTKYKATLYSTTSLSRGPHVVKVVNRGEKSTSSTGTTITLDAFVVSQKYGSYRIQENALGLAHSGTWSTSSSSNHSASAAKFSTTANAYLEHTFTGRGVTLLSYTAANGGNADIYLDGKLVKTLSMYSSSTVYQVPVYSVSGLSYGPHKIKVVNKGTKPTGSTGTLVSVDAFDVSAY
ncbi:S8 family serine peptidase [Neobacillus cucumis]|uniref:S8 family serine peptidase n=1 Tax=Neobacillus cucumis TaxID=1740721 RepID=UPI002853506B|nr:S8 family serine peptidase [Neobacillus cucumis]MDR4949950.1 S8 family serine peptidase [Neobacillus cucumis]